MAKSVLRKVETTVPEYPKSLDKRLEQIKFMMQDNKIQCMVVSSLANIRYLTNFSGSNALLFMFADEIHFVTDDRYEETIKSEIYPLPNIHLHITRMPWHYMVENKLFKKIDTLGFEAEVMPYSDAVDIRNIIRPLKFKPLPMEVQPFMRVKTPEEIEYIKQACNLSMQVYDVMLGKIKVGMSEKEATDLLIYTARSMGSESMPFEPMVLSGHRTALPHGTPSPEKKIKKNDIIMMDFGCKVNGFGSDITRTFCIGKPTKEQKTMYELVKKAQMEAINNVRPGIKGPILDGFARRVIADEGFGGYFQHALGHGFGISAHENPIIYFKNDTIHSVVPEDSVLAIEPGVYFIDKYGIRIEDNILVTRTGPIMFTQSPDTLISI